MDLDNSDHLPELEQIDQTDSTISRYGESAWHVFLTHILMSLSDHLSEVEKINETDSIISGRETVIFFNILLSTLSLYLFTLNLFQRSILSLSPSICLTKIFYCRDLGAREPEMKQHRVEVQSTSSSLAGKDLGTVYFDIRALFNPIRCRNILFKKGCIQPKLQRLH